MTSEAARLTQRIGRGLQWEAGGDVWRRFTLHCLPPQDFGDAAVELRTRAGVLQLDSLALLHVGSAIALDRDAPREVLDDMARLACAMFDDELLQALGGPIEPCLRSNEPEDAAGAVHLLFTLIPADGQERHAHSLRGDAATVLRWLEDDRWRPVDAPDLPGALQGMPFSGEILLGQSGLVVADLAGLRVGDAVFLQQCFLQEEGVALARFGGLMTAVRAIDAGTIACEQLRRAGMTGDDAYMRRDDDDERDDLAVSPEESAAGLIDDLPVTLTFTAGRVTLPLSGLRTLAAGGIVELQRAASAQVDIAANGVSLGTGELVEIDGRLAVEITSLVPRP